MLNNGEVTHLNALGFFQNEFVNPLMYIHALVTIVLELGAALKCDQLPVVHLDIKSYPANNSQFTCTFTSL